MAEATAQELRERCFELGLNPRKSATLEELRSYVERADYREVTAETKAEFLRYVGAHKGCSVTQACRKVRLKRRHVRDEFERDPDFLADFRSAQGRGEEVIHQTFRKLAIEGVEEPLVSAGKLVKDDNGEVVTVRKYSERALLWMGDTQTREGRERQAGKLGIEISGTVKHEHDLQQGVSLADVASVLREAGVLQQAEEVAGELVAETDEPADG